jgi:hypothetical protein
MLGLCLQTNIAIWNVAVYCPSVLPDPLAVGEAKPMFRELREDTLLLRRRETGSSTADRNAGARASSCHNHR